MEPIDPSRRTMGRTGVRLLSLLGSALLVLSCFGWWLDSRVIDDDGFGDVVAQASQRPEVRDYIADQATLRLARTSNFVSAARPVVTDAVSNAIATPPAEDAIREFAVRAHQQVFRARAARRVDIDAQQAATTIRSALQSINPALAKKLPANVLDASATISQNRVVDLLFRMSSWIWVWIPIGAAGIALLVVALARGSDRVRAVRTVGVTMAISGALLAGVGAATPVIGPVVAPDDPGRAAAVSAFVEVLTGRLAGAGLAVILFGLALALAPGKDGGDLGDRWRRVRAWVAAKRMRPGWRFAGGVALVLFASSVLTRPVPTARTIVALAALLGIYLGVVVCLRATNVLVTDHRIRRLRSRWIVAVAAAMVVTAAGAASGAVALASSTYEPPRANALREGCNGYFDLCAQPMSQVVWPASHNAMSSSAYNFLGAEHTITIPEQLNAGARFLMLDVYYGYDDNGIVRTNLAGGVDRKQLERERGKEAVDALQRMGALTGTADTSGHKEELYLCHDLCELGAVKAVDVFHEIDQFLAHNLTELVVLDFEDYVQPKDLKAALVESGLWHRVRTITPEETTTKALGELVSPPRKRDNENPRRLITVSEKHGGVFRWLPSTYSLFEETPYTFSSVRDFSCAPNRGKTGKSMFLLNHWLRPDGPPDPTEASHVNSRGTLLDRFRECGAARGRLPNVIAVDFTAIGDLYSTATELNAAIGRLSEASPDIDKAIKKALASGELTEAQAAEIRGYRRLPRVSEAGARKLLGPVAPYVHRPPVLDDFECENGIAKDAAAQCGPATPGNETATSSSSRSTSSTTRR
ncbi:MAG: hypothetical protein ACXVJF_09365 [Acidimicrobiia bacterium]